MPGWTEKRLQTESRKGCRLSPILFSLFINEIASTIEEQGMHGIQLPGLMEVFLLLFADDIILIN